MLLAALLLMLLARVDAAVAWEAPAHRPPLRAAAASESPPRATWLWPVRGQVVTPFHVTAHRFAPGQHRGIDIAATAGATVRSACTGRVRFAGRVPGRGRVATVVCGPLVATNHELGTVTVRPGATVTAGDAIGTVAASHLQLGARRAGQRDGYVDPLTLLRGDDGPPPLGAAPHPIRPPQSTPPRAAPHRTPAAPPAPQPARVPLAAWLGLALLAAGLPVGAVLKRRGAPGPARGLSHRRLAAGEAP
ncbi:MAG TPA: peptidoglycan DD-metalloendopeptidase family protein [Solirubrobacteraceae bacterium]|nr:peptidoglycan DD-metalloendopeptidase family protein [Solirubrobacteraceae bacterium]